MRLAIGKNGKYLHLRSGTALQLEIQSPVYFGDRDPDVIPGVKAYSLSIPNNSYNRELLERPDLLDNPDDFLEESGWEIRYDGEMIITGRMEVENAGQESDFNITIIGGLSGNLYRLKETYLFNLDLGGVINVGEDTQDILDHATLVASDPDNYNYLFPQIKTASDPAYDEADIPTQYEYCNRYNGGYVRIILIEDPPIYSSLIPMLRIRYLLQQAFGSAGFAMTGGVFENSEYKDELQNLLLFNNVTLDKASDSVGTTLEFDDLELNPNIDLTQHVPEIKANDFVRRVLNTFAWAPFLNSLDHQVTIKPYQDLLKGRATTDWTDKVNPDYRRQRPIEDFPEKFCYDHTSDDQYAEEYQLRLLGREIISYDTYDQATAGLTTDDIGKAIYIESLNEYYDLVGFRPTGTPILLTIGKTLGVINEFGEPKFDPGTDTLHMITRAIKSGDTNVVTFSGNEFLPVYYGDLVSPWFEGTKIEDLILLIYRGFQQIGLGQSPLASSSCFDYDEEKIGDLSLYWTGEEGIYNRWWKTWLEAIQRMRPVVYPTRLKASDLSGLDLSNKVRIDKHEYLIKRIQITLTTEEIQTARVEYMQIL